MTQKDYETLPTGLPSKSMVCKMQSLSEIHDLMMLVIHLSFSNYHGRASCYGELQLHSVSTLL